MKPVTGRLISGAREVSFAAIDQQARRAASGFLAVGVKTGSVVAIMLRNDFPFFSATFAAAMAGATATPINWHFTADEAEYLLQDSQAAMLVVHADIWHRIGPDISPDVLANLTVLVVTTPPEIAEAFGIADKDCQVPTGATDWSDWVMQHPAWDGPPPESQNAMIYTSGTTGRPKGVHRLGPVGVTRSGNYNAFEPGAITLLTAPMYHSAPNRNAMSAFQTGGDIVIQPRFEAEQMLALIEKYQISHAFMVPTMLIRLLKLPAETRARYDVSSLRHVVHAGSPCPAEVKSAIIDWWGPVVFEYYGGTETGVVTYCTSAEALSHPGTVGRAVPKAIVKILDDSGAECPVGVEGEIFARLNDWPDFTYLGLPEERSKVEKHGLITCGDVGYLNAQGYLFLTDRKKDMIIVGGSNVYPAQIEAVLIDNKDILDCAVFGLPDPDLGEIVAVAVQPREAGTLAAPDIKTFLRGKIADYMIPRSVFFLDVLPRDASGKMFKRKLREIFS